jgi:hypothetical protein
MHVTGAQSLFFEQYLWLLLPRENDPKLLAGAAKPSCSPDGDVKLFYVDEFNLFKFCDNHLGNAFTGFYGLGSVGKVNQDTLYLSAVVAVDGTGCVEQRQSTFCR